MVAMPGMVMIRPALIDDLPGIVALLADDDLGRGREDALPAALHRYQTAFDAIAADPNQLPLVLVADGLIAGYCQLTFIPGLSRQGMWRCLIESVRIDKALRGQRLGEALMVWAIDEARRRGCGLVQLTTDKSRGHAHLFYARLGFTATHEGMKRTL
jgi:ribosomal protein S18 acetylase RimI-like enzyme